MEKEIIDLGNWIIPRSWDDITLEKFIELEKYYSENDNKFDVREVLHILCDKTVDEVNALPIYLTDKIVEKLSFLEESPECDDAKAIIEIEGEKYSIDVMEKLKTGEYLAIDMILKNDSHDYISVLAVLCRKEGEIYDSKFEAEVFEERRKLFSRQPISKVMPLIAFFFNLLIGRGILSRLYSEVEEELSLTQRNIETSPKIGAFRRLYLTWRMRKLRKLLESSKSISATR